MSWTEGVGGGEAYHNRIRAQQRARLEANSVVTLLDERMEAEETKLRAELERLEHAGQPGS